MAFLFVFGMAHALLFDGDVLMEYAILGLILGAFRNVRQRTLLVLSCVLLAAFPVGNLLCTGCGDVALPEDALSLVELRVDHPYLGSLADVFQENVQAIPPRIGANLLGPESSLAVFSMFLLGLYVGRARILHEVTRYVPLIRWVFVVFATSQVCSWSVSRQANCDQSSRGIRAERKGAKRHIR